MTRTPKTLQKMPHPASRALATATGVICALVLIAGCVSLPSKQTVPDAIVCDLFHAPTDKEIKSVGFVSRVKKLTEQAKSAEDPQTRASIHLKLTTLLMDQRNPGRDYKRAASELGYYLAVSGDIGCADTARNVHALLIRLKYSDSSMISQLKGKVNSLSQELEQCRESFETCNETVRRLQEIELQMERKRRTIR